MGPSLALRISPLAGERGGCSTGTIPPQHPENTNPHPFTEPKRKQSQTAVLYTQHCHPASVSALSPLAPGCRAGHGPAWQVETVVLPLAQSPGTQGHSLPQAPHSTVITASTWQFMSTLGRNSAAGVPSYPGHMVRKASLYSGWGSLAHLRAIMGQAKLYEQRRLRKASWGAELLMILGRVWIRR